ncbi:MAG TPA: 50S ribosomal protein L13 [bacterium]|nr:50S ribosomal protein L13 [bacterium]
MSTTYPKKDSIKQEYLLFDAEDQILGRMATKVAAALRGKHKPNYHPAVDTGDYVIVINADKVRLTGNKLDQKIYYKHSQYPGGLKETKYSDLMKKKPAFVVTKAVRGMLPQNSLGRQLLKKLKVYAGPDHPHAAQKPVKVSLD